MNDWYSAIYKALILASSISFLISFFTTGNNAFGSVLTGYSTLVLAIIMILIILFMNILKITEGQSSTNVISNILMSTGPFLLMLGIIGFVLYLTIVYKNNIVDKHVSQNYFTFSAILVVLLLIQTFILYTNISTDKFQSTGKLSKVTSGLLYLLGVLALMCSFIISTVLKYFTVDGFKA